MLKKLKNHVVRHPYVPLLVMAGLDMAGYLRESDRQLTDAIGPMGRLEAAFTSIGGFMALFPEEIFVAITAYSLSQKMRTLKEQESEVAKVTDKLKQTGEALEDIWTRP